MTKNELKAKYGRIASDPSQLEMFKNDVIDGVATGLPQATSEDNGKVVKVDEEGKYKLGEVGNNIIIDLGLIDDITTLVSCDQSQLYIGNLRDYSNHDVSFGKSLISNINTHGQYTTLYGFDVIRIEDGASWRISSEDGITFTTIRRLGGIPLPNDASTKTYIMKSINGVFQWIEEA